MDAVVAVELAAAMDAVAGVELATALDAAAAVDSRGVALFVGHVLPVSGRFPEGGDHRTAPSPIRRTQTATAGMTVIRV